MASEDTVHELIGEKIRHLFKDAEEVAMLHACLASPRGDNFGCICSRLWRRPWTQERSSGSGPRPR